MQSSLLGRMMDFPLTLTHFLERARTFFPKGEIVSTLPDKTQCRMTLRGVHGARREARERADDEARREARRPRRDALLEPPAAPRGLLRDPVHGRRRPHAQPAPPPDRARLHREPRARTSSSSCDEALLPLLEKFRADVPSLRKVIVFRTDRTAAHDSPPRRLARLRGPARRRARPFDWPRLDENAAAMLCYTSGTTGNPKGVLYSHRSTVLHALVVDGPREHGHRRRRRRPPRRADVPRGRVGPAVRGRRRRREAGVPRRRTSIPSRCSI